MTLFVSLPNFSLKTIWLDIRISTPACFLGPFDWYIFWTHYYEMLSVFDIKMYILYAEEDGFYFHIQSVSLCLFMIELSPFTLKDINDQWLLSPINLVFIVGDVNLCVFPFFWICCLENINCLCFCWCSRLPCVGVFLLVFLCLADFGLGIGEIEICHRIYCFILVWWLKVSLSIVVWTGTHGPLMSI